MNSEVLEKMKEIHRISQSIKRFERAKKKKIEELKLIASSPLVINGYSFVNYESTKKIVNVNKIKEDGLYKKYSKTVSVNSCYVKYAK